MRVASGAESIAVEMILRASVILQDERDIEAELKTKILSAFVTGMNMLFEVRIIKWPQPRALDICTVLKINADVDNQLNLGRSSPSLGIPNTQA